MYSDHKPFVAGKKTWEKAMVKEQLYEGSYNVETANGDTYCQNRFHMKKTKESMDNPSAPVEQPQGHASSLPGTLQLKPRQTQQKIKGQSSKQKLPVQCLTVYNTRPSLVTRPSLTTIQTVTKPPVWFKDHIR